MKNVIDFLKANSDMVLASSFNDKPRASILEYYVIEDSIFFATSEESIKGHNLKQNKNVSLSVSRLPEFVTIDGHITAPTAVEIEKFTKLMFEKHPDFKDLIEKGVLGTFLFCKVVIETAYFTDYRKAREAEIIKA